ncbi:MAG: thioredoxin [Methanoregula sp.]|jgi:thioredoxin 1|nr:MAG: thioredoxin [Methanomicrobiales archaeon HGW-Methanomicrobiales-1]
MDDEIIKIREKRIQELTEKMKHPPKVPVVTDVEETHFVEFIRTNQYAVIDFWAEWCGPCRRIAPIMEELSMEFSDTVAFGKVNTDNNQKLAREFNIDAIPAIMLYANGQLVDRIIGAYPKEAIREKIVSKFRIR